jgi:hypothetical protein
LQLPGILSSYQVVTDIALGLIEALILSQKADQRGHCFANLGRCSPLTR